MKIRKTIFTSLIVMGLIALSLASTANLFAAEAGSGVPETKAAVNRSTKMGLFPEELISADELRKLQVTKQKFVLLDARSKKSYKASHIKGAILPRSNDYYKEEELFKRKIIPVAPDADAALAERMEVFPKDTQFYTYCNTGCQAGAVLLVQLRRLGFKNGRAMEDGFQVWEQKGYPVTRPVSIRTQNRPPVIEPQ